MAPFTIGDDLASAAEDAGSPSWSVRAAAGRRLAAAADVAEVAGILRRLLLDSQDTAVTQETAEALLERRDAHGLRLVLAALATAADDTGDQLYDAIDNVCYRSRDDLACLMVLCSELVADADSAVSQEAGRLLSRWQEG